VRVEALLAAPAIAAGWVGQTCFFARFLVQWLASERARRSVVPASFWWLSSAGAALMSVYALKRDQPLLLLGYVVNGALALRNLRLGRGARALDPRWTWLALPALLALLFVEARTESALPNGAAWLAVCAVGQLLWLARFPVQWWCSERAGFSHFPPSFWWLSLAGNALLLAYALHLGDALFVLGFVPGPVIQVRNLCLARRSVQAA